MSNLYFSWNPLAAKLPKSWHYNLFLNGVTYVYQYFFKDLLKRSHSFRCIRQINEVGQFLPIGSLAPIFSTNGHRNLQMQKHPCPILICTWNNATNFSVFCKRGKKFETRKVYCSRPKNVKVSQCIKRHLQSVISNFH